MGKKTSAKQRGGCLRVAGCVCIGDVAVGWFGGRRVQEVWVGGCYLNMHLRHFDVYILFTNLNSLNFTIYT